nr:mechanosensitive ion channel [Deltaproteobacteria bacterium]
MDTPRFRLVRACTLTYFITIAAVLWVTTGVGVNVVLAQAKAAPAKNDVAKEKPKETVVQEKLKLALADDEFGRVTPRSSVEGFLAAARQRDFQRAAQYLDLRRYTPEEQITVGPNLARELKIVLDRAVEIDLDLLSTEPDGRPDDGLPSYRDWVGRTASKDNPINIYLHKVPVSGGKHIWQISSITVAQIPRLYDEFGYGRLGEILPQAFFDYEIFGLRAWWWVAILILGVLAYIATTIITKLLILSLRFFKIRFIHQIEPLITGPFFLLIFALLWRNWINLVGPSIALQQMMRGGILPIIAFSWVLIRIGDLVVDYLGERLRTSGQAAATVLLGPVNNLFRVVVILVAVILWLDNIQYNVTALLAGLGVGGIAVALAAQKSIENLIGAITIYTSQPVRVGDFCRFGTTLGTIEEIGLRSTRVRTLENTLVSVPNAEFANLHLDNYSKRQKIWYHPRIGLRYETTPDQLRYILVEIRKLLYSHPKVLSDPSRVRFVGFGAYSLDIDIFAY